MQNEFTQDPSVDDVIRSIIERSNAGMITYGVSIRDNDSKGLREWALQAREEMTDTAIYLTKIIEELEWYEYTLDILLRYIRDNNPDYYDRLIAHMPPRFRESVGG